jgi:adenylate cyclase
MEEEETDTERGGSASASRPIGDRTSIRSARVRLSKLLMGLVSRGIGRRGRAKRSLRLERHELSVVACDLRGFTLFSSSVAPDHVVELLRQYYGSIGDVVAAFRGRIKDHAGDGTLVLVGAARPSRDHAERALGMAIAIARLGDDLRRRWRHAQIDIGLGIGVASGEVTVGAIEAGSRIESVAVGAAVNLASRLCARARAGQILVDERAAALLRSQAQHRIEPLEAAELKGFVRPVVVFQALRT